MDKIENDNNVYVLGAGFSRPRGFPLISNFMFALRDAHEWLHERSRLKEAASIRKVLEFRRDSMPAAYRVKIDLENIEELFSLASASNDSMSDDIRLAIAATLDYCASTHKAPTTAFRVREEHGGLIEKWQAHLEELASRDGDISARVPSYLFFVSALLGGLNTSSTGRNSFITLNYDLCLEEGLSSLGREFDYCLESNAEDAREEDSASESPDNRVPLLKLHGSVNWASKAAGASSLTSFASYEALRETRLIPELVPPTWRKSVSPQLAGVWAQARVEISRATRIVIIGFSVPSTDLHFKYLLAAGLRQNVSLREIVFVNPDRAYVEGRASELFGDLKMRPIVRVVPVGVESFVNCGTIDSCVWSIGRAMHPSFQSIYHQC